jgi:PAS domain S-box-containing protein
MNGPETSAVSTHGPPVILNVDDQDIPRYAKSRVLQHAGYTVLEAATGTEALQLVRSHRPSVVLLDVKLPDVSGTEVCRRIKADPAIADTLVLQTSATYTSSADRTRGLVGGADGYLPQPAEPEELIANVQALLRVRDAERRWRDAAHALADREAQLQLMLAASGAAVWTVDRGSDGRETFNERACALAGLEPRDAPWPRGTFCALLHPDDRAPMAAAEAETAALAGPGPRIEYRIVRPDGEIRHLVGAGTLQRDADGRPLRFIGVSTDITDRVHAEAALRETDRRKDEFIATLSHELRNPLSPIRTATQLLDDGGLDPERERWARGVVRRQVEQMSRLLDDLLDVSRITQGKLRVRVEPTSLCAIVDAAVETARPLLDARRHELRLQPLPRPVTVRVDAVRLAQVLSNLLTNAAKYTDPGGCVTLSGAVEGRTLLLSVRDTGVGWAPEAQPALFRMFSQLHDTGGRSGGGLGIGLALVRGLVELHGGTVEASSPGPGAGSEFVVRLPDAVVEDAAGHEAGDRRAATDAPPLRVLVADDNRDAADSLALLLSLDGHTVRIARDGREALLLAESQRPEVALLDIGMPGLDGYELARRLRADPRHAGVRLIALTGWGQDEDRRRALDAGFDHHLTKPVDLDDLARLLRAAR